MFKVGDKVVCVDNRGNDNILAIGKTYTVEESVVNGTIRLVGLPKYDWFDCRFKLAQDVMVEILQSEYDAMVEEINLLRELLTEANAAQPSKAEFKSVRDYTIEDWKQALDETWIFECRGGNVVKVIEINIHDDRPVYSSEGVYYQIDGMWDIHYGADEFDIMKRIK